jgi:DNA polymerase III subunit delta
MLFFIYGQDSYRSRLKLNELKDKFRKEVDVSGSSLTVIDGVSASFSDISNAINASSLFARRRMVIIENIFTNKGQNIIKDLNELFKKNTAENNIVIFWDEIWEDRNNARAKTAFFQFLKAQKFAQCFNPLSNTETINWIKKEAEGAGAHISHQAATTFQSLVGNDLWQVKNELNKMINFKAGQIADLNLVQKKEVFVEESDVRDFVRGNFDSNIFLLTDSIGNKNKAQAIQLFEDEIDGGLSEVQILSMVIRQYHILLRIREALDHGFTSRKIINALKLQPFIVNKGITQVRNYTLPMLKNIMNYLIKTDQEMKSGQSDIRTKLSLMIIKL